MGFKAVGIHAGIKPKKKDMALIFSDTPCEVGATYTTNQIKAGPVRVSQEASRKGTVQAVVFNSGNANACNGVQGIEDAKAMTQLTADALELKRSDVLVCSTGRIGRRLPMDVVESGIANMAATLSYSGGRAAAKAIMTSDSKHKECAVEIQIGGKTVIVGGMAKGAGMIHPDMATMLACVTTDLAIEKKLLQKITSEVVDETFNRISVDGDTSTNDTVFVLANGVAENTLLTKEGSRVKKFRDALHYVMSRLAYSIVEDGEGTTKIVDVCVKGATSDHDAKMICEAICRSPLVKTSWAGSDPNWGRLMDVIGYSGAKVREETVEIFYNGAVAARCGEEAATPLSLIRREVKKKRFMLTIDLHLGEGHYEMIASDLTEAYVTFNKSE